MGPALRLIALAEAEGRTIGLAELQSDLACSPGGRLAVLRLVRLLEREGLVRRGAAEIEATETDLRFRRPLALTAAGIQASACGSGEAERARLRRDTSSSSPLSA